MFVKAAYIELSREEPLLRAIEHGDVQSLQLYPSTCNSVHGADWWAANSEAFDDGVATH